MSELAKGVRGADGGCVPEELPKPPPYIRPVNWKEILKFFFGYPGGHFYGNFFRRLTLTVVVWYFLTPGPEHTATLRLGWILLVYLRNVALLTIVAGRLHLQLYVRKVQGTKYKYTIDWPDTKDDKFMFGKSDLGQRLFQSRQRVRSMDRIRSPFPLGLGE